MRFLLLLLCLLTAVRQQTQARTGEECAYTVIILSSGLDEHILRTMQQVERQAPYPGIQVTWQYKLDHPRRGEEGIRRWALPAATRTDAQQSVTTHSPHRRTSHARIPSQQIASQHTAINDPALITSFIDWSVEHYPARQYILVMSGHAVGWLPSSDVTGLRTPGALVDATLPPAPHHPSYILGYGLSLSLHDQIQALQSSQFMRQGGRFRLVLHDACLMGRAEVMADYAQVADYMIATPEQILDEGTPYAELLRLLSQPVPLADEAHFQQAARKFVDYTIAHGWQATADELSTSCFSASLFLCDLRQFHRVTQVIRSLADELIAPTPGFEYAYHDALPQVHTNALMYTDDLPRAAQINSFDLYHLSSLLAATGSPRMQALHDSLGSALDACLYLRLARPSATPVALSPRSQSPFAQVSLSLSLFAWGRYPDAAQLACYRHTRLCQLTGLDRFFLVNSSLPVVGRTSFPVLTPPCIYPQIGNFCKKSTFATALHRFFSYLCTAKT